MGAAGHIDVFPNSRNVIPGKVIFTIDFRSPELRVIEDMETRLRVDAQKICDEMGLSIEFEKVGGFDPAGSDQGVTGVGLNLQNLGFVSAIVPQPTPYGPIWPHIVD